MARVTMDDGGDGVPGTRYYPSPTDGGGSGPIIGTQPVGSPVLQPPRAAVGNGPADMNGIARTPAPTPAAPTGSAKDYLSSLLSGGSDPQSAIDKTNSQYGLGYGTSGQYYAPGAHGPGSGAVIGLAGSGGYWAQQPDGSWNFVQSAEQTGNTPNGGGYQGTGVFSDPATQQYEQLLNGLIQKLNTPYTPPGFDNAINYLNSYFQQLQGPAYTPDQMALYQTQALDPLAQQRDATSQQIIQHFAAQGIPPSSGIVQKALMDSNQQFERMRTSAQANFATGAIGTQKAQQAQAAQLGPAIANLQLQNYNSQLGNQMQGANLASIIPQLAWSRLAGSNNAIQPLNPASLLNPYLVAQQQGYNNGSNFGSALGSGLASIIPWLFA